MAYYSPYNNQIARHVFGGCPHTKTDFDSGRSSITNFLSTSVDLCNPSLIVILGDLFSFANPAPSSGTSTEGEYVAAQKASQGSDVLHKTYDIIGNHGWGEGNKFIFDKYADTFGDNTASSGVNNSLRPYPLIEVDKASHRYAIRVGNMTYIFMGDYNGNPAPTGRSGETGGRPSGAQLYSNYTWWASFVASEYAAGQNVITNTHMALCGTTTIGTGPDPDGSFYHGTDTDLDYLAWMGYLITDVNLNTYISGQTEFADWMAANPGKNLASFYAHTHYTIGETRSGRGWTATQNGCLFVNTGPLSAYHDASNVQYMVLVLEPGSTTAKIYKIHQYDGNTKMRFNSTYVLTLTLNFAFQP